MDKGRCVGYVRVSTEEQAVGGVSLAAQEERIRAFALATDRPLESIIIDAGESAKSLKRAGLASIMTNVRAGKIGTVIILKLDRLTRSVRDLADLLDLFERKKVALVSVNESLDTSTASGRLMLNLLASVSQWEREAIGERTAFALAHKRRSHKVYGRVAFGYRKSGDVLVTHESEQKALSSARLMKERGWSLQRIANWLEEGGFKPPQGGKVWRRRTVSQVLGSRMATEMRAS